jgi:outer membrane murein-binding lipoprotein Lpp
MPTLAQLAERLDKLAAGDRRRHHDGGDAELIELCARGLRQADAAHQKQHRRAELALRDVATLRARVAELERDNVQLRADVRALEIVAQRPAPTSLEQTVETDARGNVRRVVSRPLDDSTRRAGFY